MKPLTIAIFALFTICIPTCHGANILFFFGLSTYSHRITVWPLVEALAERGHTVTFFQPAKNKTPHPKVKDISPKIPNSIAENPDFLKMRTDFGPNGILVLTSKLPSLGLLVCESILEDKETFAWIKSSKYDLVVIDGLFNDCALGLAHKWGAKTVIFGTTSLFEWWPDAYGFQVDATVGNLHYGQNVPLSFLNRVFTTLAHLAFRYAKTGIFYPQLEALLKEKLNMPKMPPMNELESNVSLILMNTHFSEEIARSLPPLIVQIGGMHCTEKTKPLPKEMENFINEKAKNGFIYVSFGSGAKISEAPMELQQKFFNAFKNIKIPIIWKWEGTRPKEMPANIYTADWMPQQALLAHPKIKVFITHGGLLSMQEAIFNGVPMISFPIFAEQDYNAERLHRTKRGIKLEITSFEQKELEDAVNKILTDDSYSKKVKKDSILFKDRPQKPVDTAVWWVEYILRHDDASHLRPLSISQTWYQKRLLDVWAFVLGVILLLLWISYKSIKALFRCCCAGSKSDKVTTSSKKNKVKKN